MASSDPRPRIMAHMNKEHAAELKLYLRAFNGLSPSAAADAQLTDLTLDTLTIKSASGVHAVRVSPPMKTLADARVRLVDMAARAQELLGLLGDGVRVDRFSGPAGAGLVSSFGVVLYLVSFAAVATGFLRPGTWVSAVLETYFPYGAAGYVWLVKAIAVPFFAIHITEAWWMARSRLTRHGVEVGSALWFLWVLETFLEGYPAVVRFDGLVAEEKKKDAAKH
ncbi:hypothetical protein F5B17DRAFT_403836 [Nemania serpens]|nr:hypothetical protein F5B17DRAFT_403836 [Nemania serpens]